MATPRSQALQRAKSVNLTVVTAALASLGTGHRSNRAQLPHTVDRTAHALAAPHQLAAKKVVTGTRVIGSTHTNLRTINGEHGVSKKLDDEGKAANGSTAKKEVGTGKYAGAKNISAKKAVVITSAAATDGHASAKKDAGADNKVGFGGTVRIQHHSAQRRVVGKTIYGRHARDD